MKINKKYGVRVPATTANIGSGFDTLGMALGLYNEAYFTPVNELSLMKSHIDIQGEGAGKIKPGADNMVLQAMQAVAGKVGKEIPGGELKLINQIPLARGMGSSSAALVSGAYLANQLCGNVLNRHEILNIVTELEGHPDNVAPAIYGNLCCATGLKTKVLNTVIPVPEELHFAVIVPEVLVSTEYARSVLPNHIPFKEAVQNVSHASLFVTSLITHQLDNLSIALEDNLHVPYRKALIPHCDDVFMAAKTEGAYGATISGSGSTLIAYTDKCHVENVAKAMGEVFTSHGVENKIYCLEADTKGARII